jgi:hypothetical protein
MCGNGQRRRWRRTPVIPQIEKTALMRLTFHPQIVSY